MNDDDFVIPTRNAYMNMNPEPKNYRNFRTMSRYFFHTL